MIDDHFELLHSIQTDTPLEQIEPPNPHVLATARKRYLVEESGIVRRDKLIDLIQEEGHLTDRVRMVMYFLFLFKEKRYRDFICKKVADENGLWRFERFPSESNGFFGGAGDRKVFTNLRQLLVHVNLLTDDFRVKPILPLSSWLPDAIEIAAQHLLDAHARQHLLGNPQSFLIQHKIHGLLNTDVRDLALVGVSEAYEELPDMLPEYDFDSGRSSRPDSEFKVWSRNSPLRRKDLNSVEIRTNPALLERANGQHFILEKLMHEVCRRSGYSTTMNLHVDLLAENQVQRILFEMKSCTEGSVRSQIRRAVGQIFEYSYIYRGKLSGPLLRCIVVEREPRRADKWLIGYLDSLDICLVWKKDKSNEFSCSPASRFKLMQAFHEAANW